MSAQTKLKSRSARREALIQKSDSFREDLGINWSAADLRVLRCEQRIARRIFVHPVVPELLGNGLYVLQNYLLMKGRRFDQFFVFANLLLSAGRESMTAEVGEMTPNVRKAEDLSANTPAKSTV